MTRTGILLFFALLLAGSVSAQAGAPGLANRAAPDSLLADSLNLRGRILLLRMKYDSSQYYLEQALAVARHSGSNTILLRCLVDMGNLNMQLGKHLRADSYLREAFPLLGAVDNYEIRINALLLRATSFNALQRKDSAIYYFRLAEAYNKEKNPARNWVVYVSLAELYNQLDDPDAAEEFYHQAYEITRRSGNLVEHGHLLTLFINFSLGNNRPRYAATLISEYEDVLAERKKKNIEDPLNEMILKLTSGRLLGNPVFLREAREAALQRKNYHEALIVNGHLISYYEKKNKLDSALAYARDGEQMAGEYGLVPAVYGARRMHYELLKKTGNYAAAAALAEALLSLKDSLIYLQKREQIYELEARFDAEKRKKEIELLTSQNQLREKEVALLTADKRMASLLLLNEITRRDALFRENQLQDSIMRQDRIYTASLEEEKTAQGRLNQALAAENQEKAVLLGRERRTILLLALAAGLLTLSGLAIGLLYRTQRRKNRIIEKQTADLEVLMKEIHHRVKNNLQVVSSLLDLQSHYITDAQASEAVREGKNRVQSMALIHQNLYHEGNIKGIDVRGYIHHLLESLGSSYNISRENVAIHTAIDDLRLDVDTMIPLGLIINELVTNAYKYAFLSRDSGRLEISLHEQDAELHLQVRDNGPGFPPGFDPARSDSFGLRMIRAFTQKLKARLEVFNRQGAVVHLSIRKYKHA